MLPVPLTRLFKQYCVLGGIMLAGCASAPPETAVTEAPLRSGDIKDFSGSWEKNYQLSDDFGARFSLYVADVRRGVINTQGRSDREIASLSGTGVNVDAINGLARFTEEITRTPTIQIEQADGSINIDREDDFTLSCNYQDRQYSTSSNVFGSDSCGWNQQRLIFQMALTGGLSITQQFSLSPDTKLLNVTTRVSSDLVSVPIIISSFYERYVPPSEDYNCVLTLTRSTVCNQRGATQ
jgi:hypothetical protein